MGVGALDECPNSSFLPLRSPPEVLTPMAPCRVTMPGQVGARVAEPDESVVGEQLEMGAGRFDTGPAQDRAGAGVDHDDRARLVVRHVDVTP